MKIRKAQPQRQTLKRNVLYTVLAIAALSYSQGCEEVERLDFKDYYESSSGKEIKLPDADEYELDIAMLTEWAGNILPSSSTFELYINNNEIYYDIDLEKAENCKPNNTENEESDEESGNEETPVPQAPNDSAEDYYKQLQIDEKLTKRPDKDHLILRIPVAPDEQKDLPCHIRKISKESDEYQNDSTIKTLMDCKEFSSLEVATCEYISGGAISLYDTWNSMKSQEIPQIRLASGDSFGVSTDISARFNDIPTPLILNKLGLHADTLGNHSFDKSLSYLRNIINLADYKYVASNLSSVPQNLPNVTPYVLIEIPDKLDKNNTLRLGIHSALDMDISKTVFPGRFGTLNIDNYCNLIQSIEDAYNNGARSFFILGHLITDYNSLKAMLNALFYFSDHQYNCFSANCVDTGESESCPSVIELSDFNLKQGLNNYYEQFIKNSKLNKIAFSKFNFTTIGEINFQNAIEKRIDFKNLDDQLLSTPDNILTDILRADAYKWIIEQIHKEIFQGIIGVLGEGADPLLVPLHKPSSNKDILNQISCNPDENNDVSNLYLYDYDSEDTNPISIDSISYTNNACSNFEYEIESEKEPKKIDYHFSMFLRDINIMPYYDKATPYTTSTCTENNTKQCLKPSHSNKYENITECLNSNPNYSDFLNTNKFSCNYFNIIENNNLEINNTETHPIFFIQIPPNGAETAQIRVKLKKQNTAFSHAAYRSFIENFKYKTVFEPTQQSIMNFEECKTNLTNLNISSCLAYFDTRVQQKKTTSYNELKTCEEECEKELLDRCFQELSSNNVSLSNMIQSLNCLYESTARVKCKNEDNSLGFAEPLLFSFNQDSSIQDNSQTPKLPDWDKSETNAEEKRDRSQSTFRTSLAVDSVLYYSNEKRAVDSDFAVINTGGLKQSVTPYEIFTSKLAEYSPYDNRVVRVLITAKQFANLIDKALRETKTTDRYGGYPAFAGVRISEINNNILEAWLVDRDGLFKELIYLRITDDTNEPISNEPISGVLGSYHIENDVVKLIPHASSKNKFFKQDKLEIKLDITRCDDKTTYPNEYYCAIKLDNAEPKKYEMLTLDYLTNKGDDYNFDGIDVKETISDMQIKDYISEYLQEKASEDHPESNTPNAQATPKCNDLTDEAISKKSIDGYDVNQLTCLTLLNRHFVIEKKDFNDTSSQNFNLYNNDTTEDAWNSCNQILNRKTDN